MIWDPTIMRALLRFSIVCAMVAPAAAADLPAAAPSHVSPTAAPIAWTGFYTGVDGGDGWGSTLHSFSNRAPSGSSHPRGGLGGAYAGYNFQIGRFVTGLEGDIEGADLSGSFSNHSADTSTGSARMNWDGSLRARVGAALGPSLPYLTGGVAFAGYKFTGGPVPSPGFACCGSFSSTLTGWTVGVGLDYAFTRHLVGRIEYRYSDYGKAHGALNPLYPGVTMTTDNTTSVVRVGLSYKY
jgi:outer membrane immunogenic protein